MDDREIVAAIRGRIADRIGRERYELWFGTLTQLSLRDHSLVISVPNQFVQDWLRSQFRKDLEAAAHEGAGAALALEFRVEAPATPLAASENTDAKNGPASNGPPLAPAEPTATPAVVRRDRVAVVKHPADSSDAPRIRRRRACLSSFIVGKSNCLAHKAAQMTVDDPGHYSPLLISGPTGSGKSHLLEGIVNEFRDRRPRAAAIYLSAEQFTSDFLEALRGSGLPSFRRKYRGLELLAIDDLQFFVNKRATLVELLHTIDTLVRGGKQLVFTADRPAAALKSLGPELSARLSGGVICPVESAEFTTRLGIVQQLASRLGVSLPEEVANYVAARLTSQSRELAGAVRRLHATSLAHSRPITLSLAEEALADLIDQPGRVVQLADIEKAVCDVFGLDAASLQSGRKAKVVSHPRMLAMWLARKHTRSALSEIGAYFGRRSHSTVISAQKKIDSWMAKGAGLDLQHHACSVEETIRRVEAQLRAG